MGFGWVAIVFLYSTTQIMFACLYRARAFSSSHLPLSPSHMLGGEDGEGGGFEVLCASFDGPDCLSCIKVILLLCL
jgi:hypothetical protein